MAMMRWFRTFLRSVSLALMRCGILFRVCEEGEKGRDGMWMSLPSLCMLGID